MSENTQTTEQTKQTANLPAEAGATAVAVPEAPPRSGLPAFMQTASPAMQIMLDPVLFQQAKQIATYMSRADGFTPRHLLGKVEACFAVVTRSLTWKLDPFAVAQCTWGTPDGKIGYYGVLIQSILENSGKLEGPVTYEHFGDWSQVQGKFSIERSAKGKEYPKRLWKAEDTKGLGVIVRAKIIGESEPREWPFDLVQAFPLNATTWATDPRTQICYTAVRRFANLAAPGLLMGVPFEGDSADFVGPEHAKDITPSRPRRAEFADPTPTVEPEDESQEPEEWEFIDPDGEVVITADADAWSEKFAGTLKGIGNMTDVEHAGKLLEGVWETNSPMLHRLRDLSDEDRAGQVHAAYSAAFNSLQARKGAASTEAGDQAA